MQDAQGQLRDILERELILHRELLAIARLRHIVLRQGRVAALYALRTAEGSRVSELRHLESTRASLAPDAGAGFLDAAPRIAATIRRLGAVERANRSLLVRHVVRSRHLSEGVALA